MAGQRIMVSKPDDDSEGDIAELKKAFRKRGGCSTALAGPLYAVDHSARVRTATPNEQDGYSYAWQGKQNAVFTVWSLWLYGSLGR
jgi:hypothetical protein